jgi:threonyl-tRNA synthetase
MSVKNDNLKAMRHSCEHVLQMAIKKLYPEVKMAMGPATDEGFYFDFELPENKKVSEEDFGRIEKEMARIIKKSLKFVKKELSVKEARKLFKDNPYKQDWLDQIESKDEKVTVYETGDFVDLCKGPHVESTGKIGPFKLLSVAGAYWHGDENEKMLTRIYGTCFPSKKELDKYLWQQEEAKKRDHRILGQKLELFMFDDEVGQGLPLWLPKGAFVRHKVMEFAFNTYLENGYQPVFTPHMASEKLWSHSGHLDFYAENMYNSFGIEDEQYRIKPMNCPLQVKMYNVRPRSYKELPIRWTEMGTVYRYEKSGVLHGLTRVRGFTQDDAHIICTPERLKNELVETLKLTLYILKTFGFEDLEMNLSVRDPQSKDKFIGSDKGWDRAETALKKALAEVGYKNFVTDIGGAVFYGPKIDVKIADSLGRKWQLSTIQVDFNLPGRFKMSYVGKDGAEHEPFMIHRALLGSLERFLGVYIEHTAGAFPAWLAPVQAIIVPITDQQNDYGQQIGSQLKSEGFRIEMDDRSLSMQKRIREAELQKVPYIIVAGGWEEKAGEINLRSRGQKKTKNMSLKAFISLLKKTVEQKSS